MSTFTEKYHKNQRTEEVQDIIDRMPNKFGRYTSYIIIFIVGLLFLFGFIVKYPDIVTGKITINNASQSVKLVANSTGKIHLFSKKFLSEVEENEPIAYIQNTVSYDSITKIKNILIDFLTLSKYTAILDKLPNKITLGELTSSYYEFLSSVEQLKLHETGQPLELQIVNLEKTHQKQLDEIEIFRKRLNLDKDYYVFAKKMHKRDSLLYARQTYAEVDMDKSDMSFLQTRNNVVSNQGNLIAMEKQAEQTASSIKELQTQKSLKYKEMEINIIASYNRFMENLNAWEHKYIIKSPIKGKLQTLNFWAENQFIQSGTEIFSVVPSQKETFGQMLLPTSGAGKVQIGQEVVVKLDDFPYLEYGSVKGTVESISISKKQEQTAQGTIEAYLVLVKFDNGLKTNYGEYIKTDKATSGLGEIITKDRRLIQRFFDNLKYVMKK
ncbi:HlyD family secretion protein [Capnocytophaga canimorsus]|uniref:HlyD family secretion protein n=1 Tax=Capnocytophaga canimorsus TaxID=28188 RepID=UPI001EDEB0AB|nr:HlyD family efflux transporter periplasmic adaptor subunit [Capnocytophaga canimorsus]GJQ04855.1 hemolysin D [Capnocytophaga canimorsus]